MSSELDILISDRQINLRNDQVITLRPCKVLELRTILGLINKYVDQIAQNEDAIELAKFLLQDSGEKGLNDVFQVLITCSDKSDRTFFDNLYYDELALLLAKFIEMNKDFFSSLGSTLSKAVNPEPKAKKPGANSSPS